MGTRVETRSRMETGHETLERALPGYGVALVALAFFSILAAIAGPVVQEKYDEVQRESAPVVLPSELATELVAR